MKKTTLVLCLLIGFGVVAVAFPCFGVEPGRKMATQFFCSGDLINGWYWLRDSSFENVAEWVFENIPGGTRDLTLDLEVLATDRVSGPRGVDARFFLSYGIPPQGERGGVIVGTKAVTLPNVSPPNDPVGYTCRGRVTIPQDKNLENATTLWVRAHRFPGPFLPGEHPSPIHVAFRWESVVLLSGVSPTPKPTPTLSPGTQTRLEVFLKGPDGQSISGAEITLSDLGMLLEEGEPGQYLASFSQSESTRRYTLKIFAQGYESRPVTLRRNATNTISIVLAPLKEGETGPLTQERLFLLRPSRCDINADGPISGWWWLRAPSHEASFTFSPPRVGGVTACALNFVFLVTNRVNGGSGFTTNPTVEILDEAGRTIHRFTLSLLNPFRPRCESDTAGVGYEARGSYESSFLLNLFTRGRPFTVHLFWPFPGNVHLACNDDSV
ncbi:MAG: hypothetical protein ACP5Q4_10135, partial [Candidatus Caldatribacteriaceae bacterium]